MHLLELVLSIGLLEDVVLSTTLARLAGVVLVLILLLGGSVASHAGESSTDGAGDTVTNTLGVVVDLTLGLLLLALEILLTTGLLKTLVRFNVSMLGRKVHESGNWKCCLPLSQ